MSVTDQRCRLFEIENLYGFTLSFKLKDFTFYRDGATYFHCVYAALHIIGNWTSLSGYVFCSTVSAQPCKLTFQFSFTLTPSVSTWHAQCARSLRNDLTFLFSHISHNVGPIDLKPSVFEGGLNSTQTGRIWGGGGGGFILNHPEGSWTSCLQNAQSNFIVVVVVIVAVIVVVVIVINASCSF
jgi:hypothetical protein